MEIQLLLKPSATAFNYKRDISMKLIKHSPTKYTIECTPNDREILQKIEKFLHGHWPNLANIICKPVLTREQLPKKYTLNFSMLDHLDDKLVLFIENQLTKLIDPAFASVSAQASTFLEEGIEKFLVDDTVKSLSRDDCKRFVEQSFKRVLLRIKDQYPAKFDQLSDSLKQLIPPQITGINDADQITVATIVRPVKLFTRDKAMHAALMYMLIYFGNNEDRLSASNKLVSEITQPHQTYQRNMNCLVLAQEIHDFIWLSKSEQLRILNGHFPDLVDLAAVKLHNQTTKIPTDKHHYEKIIRILYRSPSVQIQHEPNAAEARSVILFYLLEFTLRGGFNLFERPSNIASLYKSFQKVNSFFELLAVNKDVELLRNMLVIQHNMISELDKKIAGLDRPNQDFTSSYGVVLTSYSKLGGYGSFAPDSYIKFQNDVLTTVLQNLLCEAIDKSVGNHKTFLQEIYKKHYCLAYLLHYLNNLPQIPDNTQSTNKALSATAKMHLTIAMVPPLELIKDLSIIEKMLLSLLTQRKFKIPHILFVLQLSKNMIPALSCLGGHELNKFFALAQKGQTQDATKNEANTTSVALNENKYALIQWLHLQGFRLQAAHLDGAIFGDLCVTSESEGEALTNLLGHCVSKNDIPLLLNNMMNLPVKVHPHFLLKFIYKCIHAHRAIFDVDFQAKFRSSYLHIVASNYIYNGVILDPLGLCSNVLSAADLCRISRVIAIPSEDKKSNERIFKFFSCLFTEKCKINFEEHETKFNCETLNNIINGESLPLLALFFAHGFKLTKEMIDQNNPLFHFLDDDNLDKFDLFINLVKKHFSPTIVKHLMNAPKDCVIPPKRNTCSITPLMLLVARRCNGKKRDCLNTAHLRKLIIQTMLPLGLEVNYVIAYKTALDWCIVELDEIRSMLVANKALHYSESRTKPVIKRKKGEQEIDSSTEEVEHANTKNKKSMNSEIAAQTPLMLMGHRAPIPLASPQGDLRPPIPPALINDDQLQLALIQLNGVRHSTPSKKP